MNIDEKNIINKKAKIIIIRQDNNINKEDKMNIVENKKIIKQDNIYYLRR